MTRCALLTLLLLASGCSSYDHRQLQEDDGAFVALREAWGTGDPTASVLVAPFVIQPPEVTDEETLSGPIRFDPEAFMPELTRALGEVFGQVEVAKQTSPELVRSEAWERELDYVLTVTVSRWHAEFVETNGWWWPNALLIGWYFWPIGPQWLIADEEYGVDLVLSLRLERVASETPLPGLGQRLVEVRTVGAGEEVGALEVIPAPQIALNDLDRGLDLLGTWISGSLETDQWEHVGEWVGPYARRVAAVRTAAALAEGVQAFDGLSPEEKAQVLEGMATTHALVIGVSDYDGERCLAAAEDAERVAVLLRGELPALDAAGEASAERRPWAPQKNVVLLKNNQASVAAIESQLAMFQRRAEPQDTVVVYFAGRGAQVGPGVEGMSLRTLDGAGGISLSRLGAALRAVPARRRLVLVDADFRSGPRGSAGGQPTPDVADLPRLLRDELLQGAEDGVVVLATNLEEDVRVQTFQAEDEPSGLLTLFLLRGLRGEADRGGDGMTREDLADYLRRNVENLSSVALEAPQRPLVVGKAAASRVR
jgi:hypothetical protein